MSVMMHNSLDFLFYIWFIETYPVNIKNKISSQEFMSTQSLLYIIHV